MTSFSSSTGSSSAAAGKFRQPGKFPVLALFNHALLFLCLLSGHSGNLLKYSIFMSMHKVKPYRTISVYAKQLQLSMKIMADATTGTVFIVALKMRLLRTSSTVVYLCRGSAHFFALKMRHKKTSPSVAVPFCRTFACLSH
jgi:hypothetical protein